MVTRYPFHGFCGCRGIASRGGRVPRLRSQRGPGGDASNAGWCPEADLKEQDSSIEKLS